MIVDKQKNIHIYEKIIPQIKEIIPVLEQAKNMEVGTYTYPWGIFNTLPIPFQNIASELSL